MMVAGGIVMGVFLIFVEIAYKRHRGLKEKELELAKTAADRWRSNIEVQWKLWRPPSDGAVTVIPPYGIVSMYDKR